MILLSGVSFAEKDKLKSFLKRWIHFDRTYVLLHNVHKWFAERICSERRNEFEQREIYFE